VRVPAGRRGMPRTIPPRARRPCVPVAVVVWWVAWGVPVPGRGGSSPPSRQCYGATECLLVSLPEPRRHRLHPAWCLTACPPVPECMVRWALAATCGLVFLLQCGEQPFVGNSLHLSPYLCWMGEPFLFVVRSLVHPCGCLPVEYRRCPTVYTLAACGLYASTFFKLTP